MRDLTIDSQGAGMRASMRMTRSGDQRFGVWGGSCSNQPEYDVPETVTIYERTPYDDDMRSSNGNRTMHTLTTRNYK